MTRGRREGQRRRGPMRTCCATRQRLPRHELIRVVADGQGRVHVDLAGSSPGRGAWIQPDEDLVRRIEANAGPLKRSLRRKRLHSDGLLAAARRAVATRIELELQLCRRAGLLHSGAAAIEACSADSLVLLSADAAARPNAGAAGHRLHLDTESLGLALGRGPRSRVVVSPGRPATRLRRWLQWQARLGYDAP